MARILGIDPGISGAIGVLDDAFKLVAVTDMPTMQRGRTSKKQMVNDVELARIIREYAPDIAIIEQVQAMPRVGSASGMGAASAFNFGDSAGCVRGVVGALGIERHFVVPQAWKKRAGLVGSDKEASRARAINLWPAAPLGLKKYSGRAEALLIARYGLVSESVAATVDPFDLKSQQDRDPAPEVLRLV
jgi:crossover junction endodeoxyribonuclease RuvC